MYPSFYITRSGKEVEFFGWPSSGLVENVICFTSYEFSAFTAELLSGAYDGAARTLRWIFETVVKTFAAVIDKSALTGKIVDRDKAIDLDSFIELIEESESRHKIVSAKKSYCKTIREEMPVGIRSIVRRIRRKLVGLTYEKYKNYHVILQLYHELSKYAHTSTRTTLNRLITEDFSPYLYYDDQRFVEVHILALRTIDVALWLLLHSMAAELRFQNFLQYSESLGRPIIETLTEKRIRKIIEKLPSTYQLAEEIKTILNQSKRAKKE